VKEAESLMQQVRRLYEDGVVPVREIARLAGVTERTLYKYAAKGGWRRRYRWSASVTGRSNRKNPTPNLPDQVRDRLSPQDAAPGRAQARPGWGGVKKGEGKKRWQAPPRFAPVTGAGGRFIRREDAGKPFARGIKATDAAGRVQASAQCARAETVARHAAEAAAAERDMRARYRLLDAINEALFELTRWMADSKEQPWDARAEALQYKMMDAIEAQLAALRPQVARSLSPRAGRGIGGLW
jgi:AcrR family transcriptional regulator